jgi:hypothetical protein
MTPQQRRPAMWHAVGIVLLLGEPVTAMAQISPNCQRNGRHAYCAVTPRHDPRQAKTVIEVITFADHTMVEARRDTASCASVSDNVVTCKAILRLAPGSGQPISATYRGTAYEGGYTNAYMAKGLRLSYSVLD